MATKDRPRFVRQAVRYFQRQSYPDKELILVDDGRQPVEDVLCEDPRIRYIRLAERTTLGAKLNIGIEACQGSIIQKLDDDDYYAPEFLNVTVAAITDEDPQQTIAACDCFLILIAATGKLVFSGYGWSAGPTLCFHRRLWEKQPFRNVPRAVDWWFLKDHSPRRVRIQQPELFILVRHDLGHVWTSMKDADVTDYFSRQKAYARTLRDVIPVEDCEFYERLR
jgi:glycosyltransferase involved in cell wall biosynthesis